MSTIRYNQWLAKVSGGQFDVSNVNMNVRLVTFDYVPNENDTPANVTPYILNGVSVIVDDYFCTNPMSNILDTIKAKMEQAFKMFPDVVIAEFNKKIADVDKQEKFHRLIMQPGHDQNSYQLWNDLKECGIKYFVLESTEHGILTFCEEI